MDLRKIKELMAAMEEQGMKKLAIREDGFELELERELDFVKRETLAPVKTVPLKEEFREAPKEEQIEGMQTPKGHEITSPMVGTLYLGPSPDDPPFVRVGDSVDEDTIVCIIEAMKVMNEVKAGKKGVITEILVENAHPVEFGTKLFRIS